MKVVFLAPFGIRPKGTVLARMIPLAAELQGLGHGVTIVAPPYTNTEDSGKTETVNGVTVRNIALGPFSGATATPWLAGRLLRTTLDEKPSLVHLFKPKGYGGVAAMVYVLWQRLGRRLPPLFLDTDDWEGRGGMNEIQSYSKWAKRFFQFQESWLPPRVRGVTVASRTLQTQMWGMGIAPHKVAYIPNGVAAVALGNGSAIRLRWNIPESAPVLLLYTRFFEFEQEKLYYLFQEIHRRVPSVCFLVVGQGRAKEEERLIAAAKGRGFINALRLAGWVSPPDIADYLAAGDVAIYPLSDTLFNRAKCPAKLTELLLAERAVVADNVGQTAEYIKHGFSGIICDPEDWSDMAEKTVDLMDNVEPRRTLGRQARRYLLEKFSWQRLSKRLETFYLNHST